MLDTSSLPRINRLGASRGALALAAVASMLLAPVVVRDRFNDNEIDTRLWRERSFGGVTAAEVNRRLEFTADGATGDLSFAGLEVKRWGANWDRDFEIEVDYRLAPGSLRGNRQVILGVGLSLEGIYPRDFTGYAAGLVRDDVGLVLGVGRYRNGNLIEADTAEVPPEIGELVIEFDRSDDRLSARAGALAVHLDGVRAAHGGTYAGEPMVLTIGCTTLDGNIAFGGSRVRLDEFKFEGVKQAR